MCAFVLQARRNHKVQCERFLVQKTEQHRSKERWADSTKIVQTETSMVSSLQEMVDEHTDELKRQQIVQERNSIFWFGYNMTAANNNGVPASIIYTRFKPQRRNNEKRILIYFTTRFYQALENADHKIGMFVFVLCSSYHTSSVRNNSTENIYCALFPTAYSMARRQHVQRHRIFFLVTSLKFNYNLFYTM